MNEALKQFRKHDGYAFLKELKQNNVHTSSIRRWLEEGVIEKVKPGLYKLSDMPVLAHQGMIDVCMAMPGAVVCLHSALAFYELTTTVPSSIMIALPRASKPVKLNYPPMQVFHFSEANYRTGIENVRAETGGFKIYSREKTIADCFRYRNKLGLDVAIEGLRNYLNSPGSDVNRLAEIAKSGRMYRVMKPYLEALLQR